MSLDDNELPNIAIRSKLILISSCSGLFEQVIKPCNEIDCFF